MYRRYRLAPPPGPEPPSLALFWRLRETGWAVGGERKAAAAMEGEYAAVAAEYNERGFAVVTSALSQL